MPHPTFEEKVRGLIDLYERYDNHEEYHVDCDKSDGHVDFDDDRFLEAILAAHKEEVERVIGLDDVKPPTSPLPTHTHRNDLRKEQRQRAGLGE